MHFTSMCHTAYVTRPELSVPVRHQVTIQNSRICRAFLEIFDTFKALLQIKNIFTKSTGAISVLISKF